MNTPDEWHAFVNGFCEAGCLFIPTILRVWTPREVIREHHYYRFGQLLGFPVGIFAAYGFIRAGFLLLP